LEGETTNLLSNLIFLKPPRGGFFIVVFFNVCILKCNFILNGYYFKQIGIKDVFKIIVITKGMKRRIYSIITLIATILLCNLNSFSQGFTSADYKKALWMTTRMYGGQRSGANNWLLNNHLPSGVNANLRGTAFIGDKDPADNYDLSGGWHDCGDHVKFGHTMFYSAYVLLKAYAEFPTGYDDYYTYDYKGYATSGDWTWEGKKHDPNGIPDIVDEVKHATDYFIKCARNTTTFYYQVGTGGGNADHATWVTATKMQTQAVNQGGQQRVVYKNPKDASMPSFCGATLALMARIYKKYDPAYSAQCLAAAQNAYAYAKANPGVAGTGAGGFYDPNNNWKDDYASMCAELFWTTGNQAYRTEALSFSISASNGQGADIYFNFSFDYSNNGDLAIFNLLKLGKTNALTVFNTLVTNNYLNQTQSDGQYSGGNTSWGVLRYNGNSALIVALWQKMNNPTAAVNKYIYDNIDYILGKNASNQSFIVGFGAKSPKFPHHRNIYLRDDNPGDAAKRQMTIPTKNQQAGLMVGGIRNPSLFNDDVVDFKYTEPGIDYNAGLVGALGYINSRLAPVDTNKFGKKYPVPALGPDQSICGVTKITLDSKVPTDGKKTFTWLNGTTVAVNASTTQNKFDITAAGTYTCRIDSAGKWQTEDQIVISGTIPTPNLGSDKLICDTTSYTLDAKVAGSAITYEWLYAANGTTASLVKDATQTAQTWTNVRKAGLYRVIAKATGCTSTQDDVVVTSSLPTPKDGCASRAGNPQTLSIVNPGLGTGTYEWFDSATNGNKVGTGTSISVSPSANATYYVQDASAISGSVGAKTALASNQNWGVATGNQMKFTLNNSITISSLKILADYYTSSGTFTIEILDGNGNPFSPAKTFTSNTLTFTSNSTGAQLITVPFTGFIIDKAWGASLRMRISAKSSSLNANPYWNSAGATYPYNSTPSGVFTITGTVGGDNDANNYMYFYDIQFNSGAVCKRLPVMAKIDANCITTDIEMAQELNDYISLYPNPSSETFNLATNKTVLVKVYDDLGREVLEFTNQNTSVFGETLNAGLYHVVLFENGKKLKAINVIKK